MQEYRASLAFTGSGVSAILRLNPDLNCVDSQYYVTDPEVEHIPVEELLSKVKHAQLKRKKF
jgi:hypothetical protein